jgi:hypothetical protein
MAPAYRHCIGTVAGGLALIVLAGGCGGGYTKRDFIARADAICASTVRQLRSIPAPSFGQSATGHDALAGYLAAALPLVQSESRQLHALPRPPQKAADRSVLTSWLGAVAQVVEDYRQFEAAAQRGDAQRVASAEAALRASPVASLAASYGLSSCATPGATIA